MSSLAAAELLVARARRRLMAEGALHGALVGLLISSGVLIAWGGLGAAGWTPAPWAPALFVLPAVGVLIGGARGAEVCTDRTLAALAVDRAAGSHEAFVSALTATDAAPTMRELTAGYALAAIGGRPLRALLPVRVPELAAPTAIAVALAAALAVLGGPSPSPSSSSNVAGGGAAVAVGQGTTEPSAPSGDGPVGAGPMDGREAVPAPGNTALGTRDPVSPPPAASLPGLPDAELRDLAEDLAARGVERAAEALAALARGDREAAEELLRSTLAARGDGSGVGTPEPGDADGGTRRAAEPGRWSVGSWPLRYDREVRAWLRRQVADDGRANPKGDER